MRDKILEKLAEIEAMLEKSTCEGMAIADCETAEWELHNAVNALVERVDYYLD